MTPKPTESAPDLSAPSSPRPTPQTTEGIEGMVDDLQNALHDYEADLARGVRRPLVGPLNRARTALLSAIRALDGEEPTP